MFVVSPAIDPHDVTVRDLAVNDFTFSPQTRKFNLNITWLKPSFNYSQMSSYTLSYQVNGGDKIKTSTVGVKIQLQMILFKLLLTDQEVAMRESTKVDRPNAPRSAHTTEVKILPYRPTKCG